MGAYVLWVEVTYMWHQIGSVPELTLPCHGPGPLGSRLPQERIQEQVRVREKASFIHVEKKRPGWSFLETGSGVGPPIAPSCKSQRVQLWKKLKYSCEWMRVNSRVSGTLWWVVLGILCVSKGGLFVNFVVPNSVSAFWLGGGLVPNVIPSVSVTAFVPLSLPSTCGVSFIIMMD